MTITTITPTIDVTIGGQTRLLHAYITTAERALDATATSTLVEGMVRDLAGFCLEPDALVGESPTGYARLVLVDSTELAWQRTRCRQHGEVLAPVDPLLVGTSTLRQWLWLRVAGSAHDAFDRRESARSIA